MGRCSSPFLRHLHALVGDEPTAMHSILPSLVRIIGVVAAVCLVAAVLIWHNQERLVFQPPGPPFPDGRGARRIEFRAADGQPLFAYLVGEISERGLVLVFHGNADLAVWQIPWATELSRHTGRAVLVAEFRGYGGLPGTPSYAGSGLDAAPRMPSPVTRSAFLQRVSPSTVIHSAAPLRPRSPVRSERNRSSWWHRSHRRARSRIALRRAAACSIARDSPGPTTTRRRSCGRSRHPSGSLMALETP